MPTVEAARVTVEYMGVTKEFMAYPKEFRNSKTKELDKEGVFAQIRLEAAGKQYKGQFMMYAPKEES